MLVNRIDCRIILAKPQGFCAGVVRAVDMVERAIEIYGAPVYVRHEIVHNRYVVDRLRKLGAVFLDELDGIPEGAITMFSAHGVSREVEAEAAERGLDVIDATCPLVRRVHREAQAYADQGYDVILVGHNGHAEVEGTRGQVSAEVQVVETEADVSRLVVRDEKKVAFVTQTTLSVFDTAGIVSALKARFPSIVGPDTRDICYATQNRQMAVLELAKTVELILVAGSPTSSNATRLVEIGRRAGVESHLVDGAENLEPGLLEGRKIVGITSGASTPTTVVDDLIRRIAETRRVTVEELPGRKESVQFRLPDRLARLDKRLERGSVLNAVNPAE